MNAELPLLPSYRKHLDHVQRCNRCRRGDRCPDGRALEQTWRAERRRHPASSKHWPTPDQR